MPFFHVVDPTTVKPDGRAPLVTELKEEGGLTKFSSDSFANRCPRRSGRRRTSQWIRHLLIPNTQDQASNLNFQVVRSSAFESDF